MATDYRALLAKNIAALLDANPEHGNPRRLAEKYDLGEGTVRRLLKTDEGPQPQLDTIAKLAEAFDVPPWMLLHPDFDARTRSVAGELSPEALALVRRLVSLFDRQPAGASSAREPVAAYEFSDQAREIARAFDELKPEDRAHIRRSIEIALQASERVAAAQHNHEVKGDRIQEAALGKSKKSVR